MARFQIRKRDDGLGPYRWEHVVRTQDGLARGNIYRQRGDELTEAEAETLQTACDEAGFELRPLRVDPGPQNSSPQS